ncbi:MAG: histidine phosphatase family protein [Patescibacteria group bacterium]
MSNIIQVWYIPSMKCILVRHGETDRNKNKHAPGVASTIGLNDTGRLQAKAVAQRLRDEHIDVIYCSNLPRAQETADIIAEHHPQTARLVDRDIRERDTGVFASRTVAEREEAEKSSGLGFRDWKPEGGESLRDVKHRAATWLTRVKERPDHETILVVSHGFFLYSVLELMVEGGADVEREDFSMSNGGLTILNIHPEGRTEVVHLNETSYLGSIRTLSSGIKSRLQSVRKPKKSF